MPVYCHMVSVICALRCVTPLCSAVLAQIFVYLTVISVVYLQLIDNKLLGDTGV